MTEITDRFPATRSTYARAVGFYAAFMAAWIYGFANLDRDLPSLLVALLLLLPLAVHVGVGFAIGRREALFLACFPPFLALVGPGLAGELWATLLILMIFPGAPLILLGLFLRQRLEPEEVEDWF